jgi:hypothetical protein
MYLRNVGIYLPTTYDVTSQSNFEIFTAVRTSELIPRVCLMQWHIRRELRRNSNLATLLMEGGAAVAQAV